MQTTSVAAQKCRNIWWLLKITRTNIDQQLHSQIGFRIFYATLLKSHFPELSIDVLVTGNFQCALCECSTFLQYLVFFFFFLVRPHLSSRAQRFFRFTFCCGPFQIMAFSAEFCFSHLHALGLNCKKSLYQWTDIYICLDGPWFKGPALSSAYIFFFFFRTMLVKWPDTKLVEIKCFVRRFFCMLQILAWWQRYFHPCTIFFFAETYTKSFHSRKVLLLINFLPKNTIWSSDIFLTQKWNEWWLFYF